MLLGDVMSVESTSWIITVTKFVVLDPMASLRGMTLPRTIDLFD